MWSVFYLENVTAVFTSSGRNDISSSVSCLQSIDGAIVCGGGGGGGTSVMIDIEGYSLGSFAFDSRAHEVCLGVEGIFHFFVSATVRCSDP